MKQIDAIIKRVEKFKQQLADGTIIKPIVEAHANDIINMNLSQLEEHGINSEGQRFKPYAPSTIRLKKRTGRPYDRVTLRQEGNFHAGFKVETYNYQFDITSTDRKKDFLTWRYGAKLFGLTDEHKSVLRDIISQELKQRIHHL